MSYKGYERPFCKKGHPLTGDNVMIRGGCRRCVKCATEYGRKATAAYRAKHSAFNVWMQMRERCGKKAGYEDIKVCSRWNSYAAFSADMGPRPSPQHSVDRKDVNGDYEPGNCRWATPKEQALNRRATILVTYRGKTLCLKDWAVEEHLCYGTLLRKTALYQREGLCRRDAGKEVLRELLP